MKLSKALKLKNRLAGEVARLKAIVQARNVTEVGQEVVYDVKGIVERDLPAAIKNLVTVKAAIACSNGGTVEDAKGITVDGLQDTPYWNIFLIAELKGMVELIRGLDTKNGKMTEYRGIRDASTSVEYVAQVKQADADKLVATLEKQIDEMQDTLDAFNATADIPAINGISVK
jgi:hypothetical protein